MDDTEKRLQQEMRDDIKSLTAQVATLNAQFGLFLKRTEADTSLVKRAVFGTDSSLGIIRQIDEMRRDINEMMDRDTKEDERRSKMTWLVVSTLIAGAAGWLIAAIQQLTRP